MIAVATVLLLVALGAAPAARIGGPWTRRVPVALVLGTGLAAAVAFVRLFVPVPSTCGAPTACAASHTTRAVSHRRRRAR